MKTPTTSRYRSPPAVPVDEPFEFKSTKKQTQRIDQFLCGRFSHLSRNVVQSLIEAGRVDRQRQAEQEQLQAQGRRHAVHDGAGGGACTS